MTIKEVLMELVRWAYKEGYEDSAQKREADVSHLEKKVAEVIAGKK